MAAKTKGEDSQGGGYHGGPKRWTGTGPRPARHVPWPELFKHHQSVLTGHLKMMDMVRKHCVPGTGNYDTADFCVKRTQEMLHDFKKVAFGFVPPKDNIDRVPLGASSASMYPGYSPADHIYGEASQEFGSQVAEMRKKGVDWTPEGNGPEYVVGQSKLSERQQKEQYQKQRSMSAQSETKPNVDAAQEAEAEKSEETPLWFVDPNPTPVNLSDKALKKEKRRVSFRDDETNVAEETHRKKKAKFPDLESKAPEPVEQDDISGEVESRLKKNEEKRKKKEDKKRKREEGDSSLLAEETAVEPVKTDKPKKKKLKAQELVVAAEPQSEFKEKADKKEKKSKKKRDNTEETADGLNGDVHDGEKHKKKRKKDA